MHPISESLTPAERKHALGVHEALLRSFASPLRMRILQIAAEREVSPTELAELLGEPFPRVNYNVGELRKEGLLELVDTDTRRGGKQHFYRATIRPVIDTKLAEQIPRLIREEGSLAIIGLFLRDVLDAIEVGSFEGHPARTLLRMPMVVDEQGFRETGEASMDYLGRLFEIEASSVQRLAKTHGKSHRLLAFTSIFERG
jgi:DNA-binding transcriptional ArsR family regulator